MNSDEDEFESADEQEGESATLTSHSGLSTTSVNETTSASDHDTSLKRAVQEENLLMNKPLAELKSKIPELLVTRSSEPEFDEYALVDAATFAAATVLVNNTTTIAAARLEEIDDDFGDKESCVTSNGVVTDAAASEETGKDVEGSLGASISTSLKPTTPKSTPPATPPTPTPTVTPPNTPAIASKSGSGWGSWKSWGAGLIASASQSVAKISTEIGQGIEEMQSMADQDEGGRGEKVEGMGSDETVEKEPGGRVEVEKPAPEVADKMEGNKKEDGSIFSFISSAGKGIVDGGLNGGFFT